jgi:hypothetical protein
MSDANSETSALAPIDGSPLAEASPNAVNELIQQRINHVMNTRPLLLSDDDLRVAVEYYRQKRATFILESQAKVPRAVAAAARKAVPKSVAEAIAANEDIL